MANFIENGIKDEKPVVYYVNKPGLPGFFTGYIYLYVTGLSAVKSIMDCTQLWRAQYFGKRDSFEITAAMSTWKVS